MYEIEDIKRRFIYWLRTSGYSGSIKTAAILPLAEFGQEGSYEVVCTQPPCTYVYDVATGVFCIK